MIKEHFKRNYEYYASAIIAIAFFIILYGVKVLDVTYDNFLIGDYEIQEATFGGMDSTQHYYGWRAYRQADWQFPLGCYDTFSYPEKTSIIFTDSIPLLAVFFKVLSPILPGTFQYFGMWGLLCFILQGVMSIRILRHYVADKKQLIIMSAFFITVPMFLWRMFMHTALDSQWLLLMALEPIFSKTKCSEFKKTLKYYAVVAALAASIHIYLLFFCGIILAGFCLYMYLEKCKWYKPLCLLLIYALSAAIVIAVLGGFSVTNTGSAGGLDACSMNINSMINSEGYSLFLPALSQYTNEEYMKTMQFEGYCYLGVGVILLLIGSISTLVYRCIKEKKYISARRKVYALVVLSIVSFLVALSPTVTLGDKVLFKANLPELVTNIWSIFRSTGRASWIFVYIIISSALIIISKIDSKRVAIMLLTFALGVQLVDNLPIYDQIHTFFYNDIARVYSCDSVLHEKEFWESAANNEKIEHVVLGLTTYPYDGIGWGTVNDMFFIGIFPTEFQFIQFYMGDYAISNNMTLNYFLIARNKYDIGRENVFKQLNDPNYAEKNMYIFWEENKTQAFATGYNVYYADGFYVAYDGELDSRYLVSPDNCVYYYDFRQIDPNGYSIDGGLRVNFACCELAQGEYIVGVEAGDESILPQAGSVFYSKYYDLDYIESVGDIDYYRMVISEDDSTVCLYIKNDSYKAGIVNAVSVTRVNN